MSASFAGTRRQESDLMYVKINRNVCPAQLAFCERCLGQFLKFPMGYERRCFEELVDDGSDTLTIELHTADHDIRLELDAAQRQMLAGEGWAKFMDFAIPMYRNEVARTKEPPHH